MPDSFDVYFRSGVCDIDAAARALSGYRLAVARHGDRLAVSRPGSPAFRILLSKEAWVRLEAIEIGEGTPHAARMQECDARFEVSFDSLDEVLQEYTTLQMIEEALQEVSRGFLFLGWNGYLLAPERE